MLTQRVLWTSSVLAAITALALIYQLSKVAEQFQLPVSPVQSPLQPHIGNLVGFPASEAPPIDSNKIGKAVATYLHAASKALKETPPDFETARSLLAKAQAVSDKTPFEDYKISEFWVYLHSKQKNYAALLEQYEQWLNNPRLKQFVSAQTLTDLNGKTIAQIAAAAGQFDKAIEFGHRWVANARQDPESGAFLSQLYYSTKNYSLCDSSMANTITLVQHSNSVPKQAWLATGLACAIFIGNDNSIVQMLELMCRYYPTAEYWSRYIRRQLQKMPMAPDFYWLWLMHDTNAMKSPGDFLEFSFEAMIDHNLPFTATKALKRGIDSHVFDGDASKKEHALRGLNKATAMTANAQSKVEKLKTDAASDKSGKTFYELGLIYFDNEQYKLAIDTLVTAIRNGGLTDITNARILLGISQVKDRQPDAARSTFELVATDPASAALAKAWILRSYNAI